MYKLSILYILQMKKPGMSLSITGNDIEPEKWRNGATNNPNTGLDIRRTEKRGRYGIAEKNKKWGAEKRDRRKNAK